jgi:hypothetical protein
MTNSGRPSTATTTARREDFPPFDPRIIYWREGRGDLKYKARSLPREKRRRSE